MKENEIKIEPNEENGLSDSVITWIQLGGLQRTTKTDFLLRLDERYSSENSKPQKIAPIIFKKHLK